MRQLALSDNELAVLHALWNADTPLARPEILNRMPQNNWNPNSIHLVLNNLIKKGYVRIEGLTRCGQSYGRTYVATKTQGEYAASLAMNAIPDMQDEKNFLDVMAAMLKSTQLSENTITVLEGILEESKNSLKKD